MQIVIRWILSGTRLVGAILLFFDFFVVMWNLKSPFEVPRDFFWLLAPTCALIIGVVSSDDFIRGRTWAYVVAIIIGFVAVSGYMIEFRATYDPGYWWAKTVMLFLLLLRAPYCLFLKGVSEDK